MDFSSTKLNPHIQIKQTVPGGTRGSRCLAVVLITLATVHQGIQTIKRGRALQEQKASITYIRGEKEEKKTTLHAEDVSKLK